MKTQTQKRNLKRQTQSNFERVVQLISPYDVIAIINGEGYYSLVGLYGYSGTNTKDRREYDGIRLRQPNDDGDELLLKEAEINSCEIDGNTLFVNLDPAGPSTERGEYEIEFYSLSAKTL